MRTVFALAFSLLASVGVTATQPTMDQHTGDNPLPVEFTRTITDRVEFSRTISDPVVVSTLTVTVTGAADAAVTLTLPAVAGAHHCLVLIEIVKYVTTAIAASATPVIVNTTNLRDADYTFRRVGAVGDIEVVVYQPTQPIRSTTANTDTTFVFPAVTGVKWVATVHYYTSTVAVAAP